MNNPAVKRQLLLDFGVRVDETLENFVAGRNVQVLAVLAGFAAGARTERQVHLWAPAASGKTHLLRALARTGAARYVSCRSAQPALLDGDPDVTLWAVDDVDEATPEMQMALFNRVNAVRETAGSVLVTASRKHPGLLPFRDELRSRLLWGPVFQLEALNDLERDTALRHKARERGVDLPDEVCRYLLTHFDRDMASLVELIATLDRFALEEHRGLTVPLVRAWLAGAADSHPVS